MTFNYNKKPFLVEKSHPMICCLCDKKALRIVERKGYCRNHLKEAFEASGGLQQKEDLKMTVHAKNNRMRYTIKRMNERKLWIYLTPTNIWSADKLSAKTWVNRQMVEQQIKKYKGNYPDVVIGIFGI